MLIDNLDNFKELHDISDQMVANGKGTSLFATANEPQKRHHSRVIKPQRGNGFI